MINYQFFGLCHLLRMLLETETDLKQRVAFIDASVKLGRATPDFVRTDVSAEEKERVTGYLQFAKTKAGELELQAVIDRLELFDRRLRHEISLHDFFSEIRALRETFEQGLNFKYFYKYPQNKALVLIKFDGDWHLVRGKFQSAAEEARAAVDCWALGHNTASVFHLMRVAEYGLRALARERRVKLPKKQVLDWADWQTIIAEIRKKVELIANRKRGPARDAALEFYRGALGSFEGFKDAYRNNVMHARKSYNEDEATALRNHVHTFMHRLAGKIDEGAKTQIKWGIRG